MNCNKEDHMANRILRVVVGLAFVASCSGVVALAQKPGTLSGVIKDNQTGDVLPGANVLLVGTGMGATSDIAGKYIVRNVPAGTYTVRVTYVGYKTASTPLTMEEGKDLKRDYKLVPVAIEGETVVVTAQAAGQNEAINRQLTSTSVMNVVSAARIQELPDANAAESVGRLPGVSLVRTGGEGSQVVIRGLAPQYNQVTIDGVELPSDVPSSNNLTSSDATAQAGQANVLGDRAEDLSMISSSMLGGIEVIKAITPDMDATLIGGVVNFDMRKAARSVTTEGTGLGQGMDWIPRVELRGAGSYNALKNTRDDFKLVGSVERRFFDDKLGVFIQATNEQRNLSDNELSVAYSLTDKDHGDVPLPDLSTMTITDAQRLRRRLGGTVVLDYQHDNGEIGLMNFVSSSETRGVNRSEYIQPGVANQLTFQAAATNNKLNVLSNLLSVKQELPIFHMDLKLSHSYSESHNPQDLTFDFLQRNVGYANLAGSIYRQPPIAIYSYLQPNQAAAALQNLGTSNTFARERSITGNLDLKTNIQLTDNLSSQIKFGGMIQRRTRSYDYNTSSGNQYYSGGGGIITAWERAYPWLTLNNGNLAFSNWLYDGYKIGKFLNGDYSIPYVINPDLMWFLLPMAAQTPTLEGYRVNTLGSEVNDYNGTETKSAGYAMATLNIGDEVSVIPGVRYQNLSTEYTAMGGVLLPGSQLQGGVRTVDQAHGYWLPMVHVRYTPWDWFMLHFAYTNTLNYPDYSAITPRYLVTQAFVTYNNWRLKPAQSENFDLVVAVHSNEVGLFTVTGFKKTIRDLIFFDESFVTSLSAYPELPAKPNQLYQFDTYINSPNKVDVYGIETEWQTHFWYLPQPFTGLVLSINYTHIFSEASYPKTIVNTQYDEEGNVVITYQDTVYKNRLLNQPDDILNLVMGYDYGGFSARVSVLYNNNIFKQPAFWMQERVNSAKYTRWDLSVKQDLPWFGLQIFFSINNISGADELNVNQRSGYPASETRYGMSADFGMRVKL
jgi:TonB-dependent receptor